MKMNLPNKLTVLRLCLVPVVMLIGFLPSSIIPFYLSCFLCAALFIGTAVTDMLDGKIARKYNLVTDFGKFIDPLADKFMVISSMIAILVWMLLRGETLLAMIFVWVVLIILLRELGVTSLRLVVAGKSGIVVAASMLGKIKTVSQMVGTVVLIVEPMIPFFCDNHILSYVAMAAMTITTVGSGVSYLKALWPYVSGKK